MRSAVFLDLKSALFPWKTGTILYCFKSKHEKAKIFTSDKGVDCAGNRTFETTVVHTGPIGYNQFRVIVEGRKLENQTINATHPL